MAFITKMKPSIASTRAMIRFENPENGAIPKWLEEYCFVQIDECFYSRRTRQSLSVASFDASFARHLMTKRDRLEGKSAPEHPASKIALNRYEVPVVANRMYLPGDDDIFRVNGLDYINSYTTIGIPEVPESLSAAERKAIADVESHFHHLFKNDADIRLLKSWLCYIVQQNKRTNWTPVIQGAEGDGKSWFALLMAVVLGAENAESIAGESLAEQYTGWAEGVQFCLIEEVRLHGKNRFDVLNKMKPYISNTMVPIRRMRTDVYSVLNTVNYLMVTNSKDGVPAGSNDTRYFPLFSRWQTKVSVEKFNRENPHYYDNLHEALSHGGALRKWMLGYALDPIFNPKKRAPTSSAKAEMIYLNQSDEEESFDELMNMSDDPAFCRTLLSSVKMHEKMDDAPVNRRLKIFLSEGGFSYLGVAKDLNNVARKWWSQEPDRFMRGDRLDGGAVRKWLKNGDPSGI